MSIVKNYLLGVWAYLMRDPVRLKVCLNWKNTPGVGIAERISTISGTQFENRCF